MHRYNSRFLTWVAFQKQNRRLFNGLFSRTTWVSRQ